MKMALEGIRILDMSRLAPGPYCSMILGDLGADVIRVEAADPKATVEGILGLTGKAAERLRAFNPQGRNKKSIVIDLKNDDGREVFYRLAKVSDVILEEFRPGVVKKLGVDYETIKEINPKIVYCSLTGYGQYGAYAKMPGHDINYVAMGGALSAIRDGDGKPVAPSNLLGDMAGGGMQAALGILAALVARFIHGAGQHVDCAMADGVISLMHFETLCSAMEQVGLSGMRIEELYGLPFYNVYETQDGKWFSVGNIEPWFWSGFCEAMGRKDLAGSQTAPDKYAEISSFLMETFKARTRDEWFEYFKDKNICTAPVYTLEEAMNDPHYREREMAVDLDHPEFGTVRQVGISMKLSETPGKVRSLGSARGAHTDAIMEELGYSDDDVRELKNSGAVA